MMDEGIDLELAERFLAAIINERRRAHVKHGDTSMEQSEPLSFRRAAILMEEAAECGKALNDREHGDVMLAIHSPAEIAQNDELDKELIQTAAMAYTWWANRRGERLTAVLTSP